MAVMELYTLDSFYRRQTVIDEFVSLIWTERFSASGDINLQVAPTLANRALFKSGVNLGLDRSYRVMQIETVTDGVDAEGNDILTIVGPSLEAVLDQRLARGVLDDSTSDPQWTLTGTPVEIATQMFHDICVTGVLDPGDIIPLINEGSIFPADTIPAPTDVITVGVDPQTLYAAETNLCNQYLLGFRLVRNKDAAQLWFDVYTGSDRTSHQTDLPAVIFSPGFDNLKSTTEVTDISGYKNVAYVITPVGCAIVYAEGVDSTVSGFDRRVLVVNNTDITDTDPPTALAQMIQLGQQQLALNRQLHGFDGEIAQDGQYQYGRDYNLGDLVEVRSDNGVSNSMQVTEQIFAEDGQGARSYPTLVINEFITPGSWAALPAAKVWADYGPSDYWEDQ